MDRVKSSMQQVPNPIPKVLSRRTGGANSLEAEKENFERSQAVSINKAINTQEIAVKEKHARNILLFKGAHTFWLAVNRLPLSSNAVLCWKFCHVFHKLLRDGHPNVIKDSMRHKADLNDMSRMWVSNPRFPGNLQMSNRQLDEAGENDVNNFFQLTVEMFDYLECELNLFLGGKFKVECRCLKPQKILSFSCPPGLPADTLQGHRDRFQEQFKKLKSLFYRSSNLQYFKRLIQIPQLPEVRLLHTKPFLLDLSPKMRLVERNYVTHLHICLLSFLASGFSTGLQENTLYATNRSFGLSQSGRLCQALRGRVNELEAELAEQTHLKQQALGESEFLRVELDDLRRVKEDTEKEQRSLSEIERKAQANEQRYTKLKEKYTELVQKIDVVCYFVFSEQKLRPRGLELQQGELGDLVEQEMAATSAAVESAAARIEEMLNKSRAVDTGIKMEVNERILASCTDLMQAIKVLVLSSKDLQRDIVESGRGAASMKEFYAKNSRWTEGLISASKAVGWGATMLVDAADQVVQGTGKFEELMVCSHEIAASTAQLVAASKVKADKDSPNLSRLRQASKGVTQATAGVVASTKSGKSQIEDTETMDFSAMTLTQIKRQEMDAQVLVLELETRLQKERERLGELRKKHYELAGVAEGWGGEEEGKTPNNTTNSCLSTTQYRLTISQNCFLLKNLPRIP
uniref:Huntingtin-interacting protein 1-related protein n=1 Tax=Sinocyclocheilus rhinocerous TaxID=307959 RepID=A0A673K3A3_9TELE